MISFFGKKPFFSRDGHIYRGSTIIRGQQIAEYLGEKYNPYSGYENDVCVYVKPELGTKFAKKSYVDLLDGYQCIAWLKEHPEMPIIVASSFHQDYLIKKFDLKNRIVVIPQHHCNYLRETRPRREVETVGFIGVKGSFMYSQEDFREKIENLGMKFEYYSTYKNRQDVVDFYKKIDIQIIWRPKKIRLKNCLKIINAASFGIPTVAYPEDIFTKEMPEYFRPALTIDEAVQKIKELREYTDLYKSYASRGILKAEEYHIENIIKLYKQL